MKKYFLLGCICLFMGILKAQPVYFDIKKEAYNWSVGLTGGSGIVFGDIAFKPGYQFGLMAKKTHRPWLDLRLGVGMFNYTGIDADVQNIKKNNVLNGEMVADYRNKPFYFNYQTSGLEANVAARLKPIQMFNKKYEKAFDIGVLVGLGISAFETKMDLLGSNNQTYAFTNGMSLAEVTKLLDKKYETLGQIDDTKVIFGRYMRTSYLLGGVNFRFALNERMALGLDVLAKYTGSDLIDGQQWKFDGNLSESRDMLLQSGITIEYMFGK
ncbi:MAG: hypothetical protein ACKVTZ_03410 [Bacteroidia bacterium]